MRDWKRSPMVAAATVLMIAACATGGGGATTAPATSAPATSAPGTTAPSSPGGELTHVRLQLQWEFQSQFAGYFAADEQGYYAEEGLEVEMLRAGPDVVPQDVGTDPNGPEFTIAWVPKVLQVRANEAQSDLVNIAQIFQRSGTRSVSWAAGAGPDPTSDEDITSPEQFAGKNIGVWDFGNEFEVTAGALMSDLVENEDYTKVIQPFNMDLLLNREIDVAEAMTYNEYAQVLETINPKTNELYQPEDLNVIDWNEVGSAMLQDALWARAAWLAEEGNEDIATRFLRASFRGWAYCRENQEDCAQYAADRGSILPAGHQAWMMNEVNPLIWPSPDGIGHIDQALWDQTVGIAVDAGIIPEAPPAEAFRNDLADAAREGVTEDLVGADFEKGVVEPTEGGQ